MDRSKSNSGLLASLRQLLQSADMGRGRLYYHTSLTSSAKTLVFTSNMLVRIGQTVNEFRKHHIPVTSLLQHGWNANI